VDGLYDGIEVDAALRPLFGRDLATERESQKRFFTDWLGGEGNYRSYLPLKHRHDLLPITRTLAGKLLHLAVCAGRGPVVELLLDSDVDVNLPSLSKRSSS
jgi:truncated hemoglobin YjbI